MAESDKRVGAAVDRIVGASAGAGIGILAALALGAELGSVIGNASGPLVEEVSHAARQVIQRRFNRVHEVVETAASYAELETSDFLHRSLADDNRTQLMAMALEAAADAVEQRKIVALARAYARGVLAEDDAKVDEQKRIVATLAALDPIDVRALDWMAQHPGWLLTPEESLPQVPTLSVEVPQVAPVLESVVMRLSQLGLIDDKTFAGITSTSKMLLWRVTGFGLLCVETLRGIGESEPEE